MTYPFLNLNGVTVEIYEWICNSILHFTGRVIIYTCWDLKWSMLVKGAPGLNAVPVLISRVAVCNSRVSF